MHAPERLLGCVDDEPYISQLIFGLVTNHHLHNTGKLKLVKWILVGMVLGGVLGCISNVNLKLTRTMTDEMIIGATIGSIIGLLSGDAGSNVIFKLIHGLQTMSEEQKDYLVSKVQGLVGSSSMDALNNFIRNPNQLSDLLLLLTNEEKLCGHGQNYNQMYLIFAVVVFAVFIKSFDWKFSV